MPDFRKRWSTDRDAEDSGRLAAAFEVFNISARSPFSPADCSQLLSDPQALIRARFPEIEEVFAARGWPLPTSIDRVYAIDKAESHLGYHPRYNYREYLLGANPVCSRRRLARP